MVDFVKPITNKDITTCQLLITDLKKHVPDEPEAWEQPLISLVKGIEQQHDHETLLSIMHLLSPKINEALLRRLLSSPHFNYLCLNTLIEYINNEGTQRGHQVTLINYLLTSPLSLENHPEAQRLLLKLNAKEQKALLIQLNDLQKQNFPLKSNENKSQNQRKFNPKYQANYKQLVAFLTTHASARGITEQDALSDEPHLANILMMQLFESNQSPPPKKLLLNVLKDKNRHDWDDALFSRTIQTQLIALFAALPIKELKDLFKQYIQITPTRDYIPFLDELYANTQNADLIGHCIEAIDDSDHSITINFLTRSKINNNALRLRCLKKIDIEQLSLFCGHIVALRQIGHQELFNDYIGILCEHLKKSQKPQELIKLLTINIHSLPINEELLATTMIINCLQTPELVSLWLQNQIQLHQHKTPLLPHCLQFIKGKTTQIHLIPPIIKKFSSEDLLALYFLIVTKEGNKNEFNCFTELFKNVETHPQLFYILSNTPAINHDLLLEWVKPLDDKTLISLIDYVFSNTSANQSEFKTTINHILVIFCQRLYSNPNSLDPINQWQNQSFTYSLVHHLLDNPECVYLLTTTYSSVYSWATWSRPIDAMKHRMDAVLNCIELEDDRINHMVLNWLNYFYDNPEHFTAVFNNLNYTDNNRTAIGKKNLLAIKHAYWKLMKPGLSYVDEEFVGLAYCSKPASLSLITTHLTKEEYLQTAPCHGSIWLATKLNEFPAEMNGEVLIGLLVHSLDEVTSVNWKKTITWFEKQSIEKQLVFAKKLINKAISSHHNPMFVQQTHQWLTADHFIDSLWLCLDPLDWDWLFKHATQAQLEQHMSTWLDLMLRRHEPSQLNLGKILSLVPKNEHLITTILQKTAFTSPTILAQIVLQLALEPNCSLHCNCLYQLISEQDKTSLSQILKTIMPQLPEEIPNTYVLHILTELIVHALPTLTAHDLENRNLIIDYLQRLHALLERTESGNQINELKQLMLRTLQTVMHCDSSWNQFIAGETIFTQIIGTWLHNNELNFETEPTNNHPFSQLLLTMQPVYFESKLKNDPLFQRWLQTVLINASEKLSDHQFSIFFNALLRHNRVSVAQAILAKTQLSEIQTQCLELLANALSPTALFELFANNLASSHLLRALFCQREGLKELSSKQRFQIFTEINSPASLLNILEGGSPLTMRLNFIAELFEHFGQDAKTLSQKLESWFLNSEAIAALSNLIIEKKHQDILKKVLEEKVYYQDLLHDYLHQPTLDIPLNKDSYLYHLARANLLSADVIPPCNASFMEQLPPEEIIDVIKKQYYSALGTLSLSDAEKQFSEVLSIGLKGIISVHNNEINQWIFQFALFSSLSASVDETNLKNYLTSIKSEKLALLLYKFYEKAQCGTTAYDLLQDIKPNHASQRLSQLIKWGFSYNLNGNNAERLHLLTTRNLIYTPSHVLIECLNSYVPLLTEAALNPDPLLETLNQLLSSPDKAQVICQHLDSTLMNQVIITAIKNPGHYSNLLEKLINSNYKETCLRQLQSELHQLIKSDDGSQPADISHLAGEQIEAFPNEVLDRILSIQRLLFFGKPVEELQSFIFNPDFKNSANERQLFGADACLYMVLIHLEKKSKIPMKNCGLWLIQHQNAVKTYAAYLDRFNSGKEVTYPVMQYYWLCWKAFIFNATQGLDTVLTDGLIEWLRKSDSTHLRKAPELCKLLSRIGDLKLIPKVLKNALAQCKTLNAIQIAWLCEHSMELAPKDASLVPIVINLSSWSWLESYMKKGVSQNWELLKAALGNKHYLKTINESEQNQIAFLGTLEINKLTQPKILELIAIVTDEQTRSLLIIHFLSQPSYLTRLKGESVLTQLTSLHPNPSRLNALIHQLDINVLSEALIDKLMPEAAVSLLCSFPHFHQLNIKQIDALLKKYPHPEVIIYWINHYSAMPNAHFTLAHLMKLADSHIITQLNKMEAVKKEAIMTRMIEHLELFHPTPKILFEQNIESRLNLAIRLYLNGHQEKIYVHYINRLTTLLLNQNHQFAPETIPLLISLNAKHEFNELTEKTAYLTNYYLRSNAQAGQTRLFYHEGRANNESMNQLVQLNPPVPKASITGFFKGILSTQTEEKRTQASDILPEDSLIEKISYRKKQISSFDYFLIHFHGDKNKIGKAIDDYLSFYAREGCTKNRRRLIYQTSDLMIRPEIEASVREALYTAFLRYPDLHDKQITLNLFLVDAQKTIKHFGLQGGEKNYTHVINLCTWALKKLDSGKHAELRAMAATALAEAELELSAHEERGFFGTLFMHLKRCWVLGWTGFFSPNLPVYVAPATDESTRPLKKPRKITPNVQLPIYRTELNLVQLLHDLKTLSPSVKQLNELIDVFNKFTIKAQLSNELDIRQQLNDFFHQLSLNNADKKGAEWLKQNAHLVTTNATRLLELALIKGDRATIGGILKTIHNKPEPLQQIADEWNCPLPDEGALSDSSIPAEESNILETTTELAYSAWSWTREGLGALFSPYTEQTAPSATEQSASAHFISCTQHL